MTPGHYMHKASEFIGEDYRRRLRSNPMKWNDAVNVMRIMESAKKAPIYLLPDDGNLIAPADPAKIMGALFLESPGEYSLPHDELVVEFFRPKAEIADGPKMTGWVCVEPKKVAVWARSLRNYIHPKSGHQGIFECCSFFQDAGGEFWSHEMYRTLVFEPKRHDVPEGGIGLAVDWAPFNFEDVREKIMPKIIADQDVYSALPILSLMAALSCRNVSADAVEPDAKLNKKRLERGKTPFVRYHVLQLSDVSRQRGESLGGSHASPALHVRRGHIRRYPKTDNHDPYNKWINQQLIGDPMHGVVRKDYALPRQK